MSEKFERFSVSVHPTIGKRIRKAAAQRNIPVSRFLVNSTVAKIKDRPATMTEITKLQKEMRTVKLMLDETELASKLNGNHVASDYKKYIEIRKQRKNAEFDEMDSKPVEVPDGMDIISGKTSIQKARQEIAKAKNQQIKEIVEAEP